MTELLLPVGDRVLDVAVHGRTDGTEAASDQGVLVYHHGTPGWRVPPAPVVAAAARRGLRLVSWSRPGYAASTRDPGRTVAEVVGDLRAVLDHLGVERAHVMGWSGGGPHALASACLAPDRVAGALLLAGVAPYDAAGLDWLAGMGDDNIAEFGAALEGEASLRALLEAARDELAEVTGTELVASLSTLLPEVDVAALGRDDLAEDLAASFRAAVSTGIDGWLDDDLAFVSPWGFDATAPEVPVHVWQGDADLMVPFDHGRWLAAEVAGATSRLLPGEGHVSIGADRVDEALDGLLSG
ncbi:alpha/beta fold hydrolase [Nocardioides sp.]|uniref:alpha/beta fold hydrolase n=1 Tax=Nocardioides sp. TaxID=35761 RepID=UPI0035280344